MKRYGGKPVVFLLIACIMLFSLWNPLTFASSMESQGEGEKGTIEGNRPPGEIKTLEETATSEEIDTYKQSDSTDTSEQLPEAEGDDLQLQDNQGVENELQDEGAGASKGVKKEEEKDETEELQEILEEGIDYYPSSSSYRVGPILGSLNFSKTNTRKAVLNNTIEGDYIQPIQGLTLTKEATVHKNMDNGRQLFKLDLTATAESNIVISTKPSDIILVLDRSGSMDDVLEYKYTPITSPPQRNKSYYIKIDGEFVKIRHHQGDIWRYGRFGLVGEKRRYVTWDKEGDDNSSGSKPVYEFPFYTAPSNPIGKPFYTREDYTKLQALKDAALNFVNKVYQESPDSKIAVVSYSGGDTSDSQDSDGSHDTQGLVNIEEDNAINPIITGAINGLTAEGATHSDKGLDFAKEIFQQDQNRDRNRVVIMFTDGEPGNYGFDDKDGSRYAAAAINQAAVLKGQRGESISSNVQFNGKKAGKVQNELGCGATVYTIGVFPSNVNSLVHAYMAWVSSDNNPNATDSNGHSYYFTANNIESLENVFEKIAEETGETIENVVIKDYIDPRFDLVDAHGNLLQVGDKVDDGTIKSDNQGIYVQWEKEKIEPGEGKGFQGSLYLKPKDDFIGGNNVPTNIPNISAVYSQGNNIGSFPYPLVNVPFKLNIQDAEDSIFLGEGLPRDEQGVLNEMVQESLDYAYPSGMVTINWQPLFPQEGNLREDKDYQLNIRATPKDYIQNPNEKFYHTAVGTKATEQNQTGTYRVKVHKGTLTIHKEIQGTVNPDQTFVFEIRLYNNPIDKKLENTFYETIRVEDNNNSRKVIQLPKGYYEVEEKTDWSWAYSLTSAKILQGTLGMDEDGERRIEKINLEVSFENQSKEIPWLHSIPWVVNKFSGGGRQ